MIIKDTNTSNTQKAIKGISSQTLVTLSLGVIEIALFSIMSRLLSKEDFGYYAVISAIMVVFTSFSETGIGAAIIQRKETDRNYINNAFTLSLLFGSFIMIILLLLSGVISDIVADEKIKQPLRLMAITLLLNNLISINVSIMYKKLQFLLVGYINLFSLLLTSIIAIILAYKGFGYYAIITRAILTSILTFAISLFFCKTKFSFFLNKEITKTIFRFSGWLMASVVFRNLAQQIDRLMMPSLMSITTLGAYNRPKDFINNISSKINGIFDTVLFPVLSNIQNESIRLENAFRRSFYLLNLFSIFIGVAFIINSELIIHIFFGGNWLFLRNVFCIFALSFIFNVDGRLADCFLRSLALTKQQFYFRVVESIVKIIFLLIGCQWGMIGVATFVVLADALMKIVKIFYVAQKLNIGFHILVEEFVKSSKFLLLFCPIGFILFLKSPHTWSGEVVTLIVFLIVAIVVFFFFPKFVGKHYYDDVWTKCRDKAVHYYQKLEKNKRHI